MADICGMEYKIKQTAFLDILGFGDLVMRSAEDPKLTQQIFDFLSSIDPNKVHSDAYGFINKAKEMTSEELANVEKMHLQVAEAFGQKWPIDIAYFSDSLVLSAEDSVACYIVLELICKLMIRIWNDYGLLIRGGISIDKLVHISNGPIFGPAMNAAYFLESKHAKHPRVIFDAKAFAILKNVPDYNQMKLLFSDDGDYQSITLASAYEHLLNTSLIGAHPTSRNQLITEILATSKKLEKKIAEFPPDDDKVKPKYVWIKEKVDDLIARGKDSFLTRPL